MTLAHNDPDPHLVYSTSYTFFFDVHFPLLGVKKVEISFWLLGVVEILPLRGREETDLLLFLSNWLVFIIILSKTLAEANLLRGVLITLATSQSNVSPPSTVGPLFVSPGSATRP